MTAQDPAKRLLSAPALLMQLEPCSARHHPGAFGLAAAAIVPDDSTVDAGILRGGAEMSGMTALSPRPRTRLFLVLVLGLLATWSVDAAVPSTSSPASYRVEWTARRAADSMPLRSASVVVRAGQSVNVRTDSTRPGEDQPAFPNFAVTLSRVRGGNGVYELYIRVGMQEVIRTRKGKLRKKKRNISALIPVRAGETQQITPSSDLIRMDVRLERR